MRFFCLLAAGFLVAVPAQAQSARDVLSEVAKCADIAAAKERLECYDAVAGRAKTVMTAPAEAVPVRQATAQPAEEEAEGGVLEWFGLSRPVKKEEDFGKPPVPTGPKEIKEITSGVLELAKNPYGRSIFILDNGQVWKQIDGDITEVRDPSRDEKLRVSIETGMFGSYSLKIEGRTGIVKVRRVK